jgi:glycosyltransferase involved in cell wall biosynthesis
MSMQVGEGSESAQSGVGTVFHEPRKIGIGGRAPRPGVSMIEGRDRIRLMKFVAIFAIGGTERQVVNIGKGLDRSRFDLRFATLNKVGELLAECEAHSWLVDEYKTRRLYGLAAMKQQIAFARSLRRERTQILHTYGFYPNVFAVPAARLAGVPVIIGSIRDIGDTYTFWQHEVQKHCLRLADHIVVNAEAIKRDLVQRGYDEDRLSVIPNGIDCERFRLAGNGEAVRREWNIPPGVPVVGVLARLLRIKGQEVFLHAAALIASNNPRVRFVLVGDNNIDHQYKAQLKRLAGRLGLADRVLFTGFRTDVPDLLAALSVVVSPSLGLEGLSNSLLESMAAGVSVVATRVGGTPEIVEDGENGLLVPPGDPEALAAAVSRLLQDKATAIRLRESARRRVFSRYSLEQAVASTQRLYDELLDRAREKRRFREKAWS